MAMTPQEFAERMRDAECPSDPEAQHGNMDDLMCELLRELGYGEGIAIFEAAAKWYA